MYKISIIRNIIQKIHKMSTLKLSWLLSLLFTAINVYKLCIFDAIHGIKKMIEKILFFLCINILLLYR